MKKVFISRKLSKDSSLLKLKEVDYTDQSLLSFSAVPFTTPDSEWLFFYSQNGVLFYLEQEKIYHNKIAAIGPKTAKALINKGYKVDFIGDGNPQSTAKKFKEIKNTTCYIRAKDSANSIKKIINDSYDTDVVVYDNQIGHHVPMEQFDILIFTSTKNAQAYFNTRAFNNEIVISIGKPTQRYLKSIGIQSMIPNNPTEEGIYELLFSAAFS